MIYIHAENLGLLDQLVNTLPLLDATAKDFSWSIRLSTEDTSNDKDVTVVEMPQEMALSLFFWYMNKESSSQLSVHLFDLLDHEDIKKNIIEQLEWSVAYLDKARQDNVGRSYYGYSSDMAKEIEDHIEYGHEVELYALLDAKGFEKFVEVEA